MPAFICRHTPIDSYEYTDWHFTTYLPNVLNYSCFQKCSSITDKKEKNEAKKENNQTTQHQMGKNHPGEPS